MSRRKRTGSAPSTHSSPTRRKSSGALAAALTLTAAGIIATAWMINAEESRRVTTTVTANSNTNAHTNAKANAGTTAAGVTAPATMQHATATPQAQPATQQPSAPSAAGQRAFIDPVSGQLRQPEHEELAAIAAAAPPAAPAGRLARTAGAANAAPEFFDADGAISAVVPEDLHTFAVATRGPDGRITIEHAQGAKEAVKVMKANSAKKQAKEDRNDR
jgi:hypothetical protein